MLIPICVLVLSVIGCCLGAKNVLFLVSDDMRPQLGCYDDAEFPAKIRPTMQTTNLDALAAKSLLLKKAYVQYPVCAPSRTSLLTGRRPDTTQVYGLRTYWRNAGGNFSTLPQYFKEQGYTTVGMGKIFHPGSGSGNDDEAFSWSSPYIHKQDNIYERRDLSWEAVPEADLTVNKLKDQKLADEAVTQLSKLAADFKNNDTPFFLAVGFHKPHLPFVFPESFLDYYPEDDISLPDSDNLAVPTDFPNIAWHRCSKLKSFHDIQATGWKGKRNELLPNATALALRRAYYASVSYIDSLVGQVVDELTDLGIEDDTVIAFWGDHGYHLSEHSEWCKTSNFELTLQAPMIIHIPGETDGGIESDALVEFVDLFPTLVEAADLPQLPLCPTDSSSIALCREGDSLIPLITNPNPGTENWKNAAFSQVKTIQSGNSVMGYSVRTYRFRYTEWVLFNDATNAPDWDTVYGTELYDHDTDPYENTNQAVNSAYSSYKTQLSQDLHDGWRYARPST